MIAVLRRWPALRIAVLFGLEFAPEEMIVTLLLNVSPTPAPDSAADSAGSSDADHPRGERRDRSRAVESASAVFGPCPTGKPFTEACEPRGRTHQCRFARCQGHGRRGRRQRDHVPR